MSKYSYSLWFPMVGIHGSCFDTLCEKCQTAIEEKLEKGFGLPCTITVDTSMKSVEGYLLQFSFSRRSVNLCENCSKNLELFFTSAAHFQFGQAGSIELWRNKKEEAEQKK